MRTEIICSGFGGPGVLTTGLILANNCLDTGMAVTWIPSYGSEMRGGAANCHIKISDNEIFSPYVKTADVLIALNEVSLEKFERTIRTGGHLFVNTSIVAPGRKYRDDIRVLEVPMTEMANDTGNPRGANLVMLGAFVAKNEQFDMQVFRDSIDSYFAKKGKGNEKNAVCFTLGYDYARNR